MLTFQRTGTVFTTALALLAAAGCDQADPSANAPAANAPTPAGEATVSTETAPAPEQGAEQGAELGASPISERDLRRQREFEEAIRGLSFAGGTVTITDPLEPDPAAAAAHFLEGETLLASNQRTEAIKAFAMAVRSAPENADPYLGLGEAFITKGKTEHAAASYRTAAALDADSTEARSRLAMTLSREGRNDEASEVMREVLAIDPDHGFAHERLAIWSYYAGEYRSAWEHVGHARRVGHEMPPQFIVQLQAQMPDPAS